MSDDLKDVGELATLILNTSDPDVKFRSSTQMLKSVFDVQKNFLISIRLLVKDKKTLNETEVKAIQDSVESLISGINQIQGFFDVILKKEYKVN